MNEMYKDKRFWNIFWENKIKEIKHFSKIFFIVVGAALFVLSPLIYGKYLRDIIFTKPIGYPTQGTKWYVRCTHECNSREERPAYITTNTVNIYPKLTSEQTNLFALYGDVVSYYIKYGEFPDTDHFKLPVEMIIKVKNNFEYMQAVPDSDWEQMLQLCAFYTLPVKPIGVKPNYITNEFESAIPHSPNCKVILVTPYDYGRAYLWLFSVSMILFFLGIFIHNNIKKAEEEYNRKYKR